MTPPRPAARLALALAVLGCSPDSVSQPGPDAGDDVNDLPPILMPAVAHSGFDGEHTFRVPVYTSLEDAAFEVTDEAIAVVEAVELPPELEPVLGTFGKSWAMITTRRPGTTGFSATAGDVRLEATLVVAEYDPAVVTVGGERYNDPADADQPDRVACQSCHGSPTGVDHTPLAMAYFEDPEILEVVRDGLYPDGEIVNDGDHKWGLTETEAAGIVPYLRSLQPRGF